MGEAADRADANDLCIHVDEGDHLWIIDSSQEFSEVMNHFFGPGGNMSERATSRPEVWTDAIWDSNLGHAIWEMNGAPVTFEPAMVRRRFDLIFLNT